MSRVWHQFPTKAAAFQPLESAYRRDAVLVPQVSAEVQVPGQQEQPQVCLTVAGEMTMDAENFMVIGLELSNSAKCILYIL